MTRTLPDGEVAQPYAQQLIAEGGRPPLIWSLASGALPAGISLSSDGSISGEPTLEASATLTVQVQDAAGQSSSQLLTLVIGPALNPPAPTVTQIWPGRGPQTGGSTIEVLGSGFIGVTAVDLGPRACSNIRVLDAKHLTAVVPPGTPAKVERVKVTAAGGTSTPGGGFSYYSTSTGVLVWDNLKVGKDVTRDVLLADITGRDGVDLLEATSGQPDPSVRVRHGASARITQSLGDEDTQALATGDIDGDGDIDLVTIHPKGDSRFWINDGSGRFTAGRQTLPVRSAISAAMGDIDGDGDTDLVVGTTAADEVWTNNGSGAFTITQSIGQAHSNAVELADLDGDQDLDLVIGNYQTSGNQVWMNDGLGQFTNTGQTLGSRTTKDVALGDLDRDGDIDMVVANDQGNFSIVWWNDGAGRFSEGPGIAFNTDHWSVALADFNTDGFLDIVLAGPNQGAGGVWLNTGSGSFKAVTASDGYRSVGATSVVAVGDLDGDGDDDLVEGNYLRLGTRRFRNRGQPIDITPPAFAGVDTAVATAPGTVTLKWSVAVDDRTKSNSIRYDVFHATSAASIDPYRPQRSGVSGESVDITGLSGGVEHFFMVRASDGIGNRSISPAIRSATPLGGGGSQPRIETDWLPDGVVAAPYAVTLRTAGGRPPYSYAVRGRLPGGFNLDPGTGILAGTPTDVDATYLVFEARDADDKLAERSLNLTVLPSPAGRWRRDTAAAAWTARQHHGAVSFGGRLWMFGGEGGQAEVWNSADGVRWQLVTAQAPWGARSGFTATVFSSRMWVLGGTVEREGAKQDVWHSVNGSDWTMATAQADWSARLNHGVVTHQGAIWVLGGLQRNGALLNDVWKSTDGAAWTQVTVAAPWLPRRAHRVVSFANRMWVLGGDARSVMNDVWSSTDGYEWTRTTASAAWSPRLLMGAAIHDKLIWIAGGLGTGWNNGLWYSSDGRQWTKSTAMAPWSARSGLALVSHENALWVYGGSAGASSLGETDVSSYR